VKVRKETQRAKRKPESQAKDRLLCRARFVEAWGFEQETAYCSRLTGILAFAS
jgi:hypothetical protein